jgi:hypothetical protein
MDDPVEAFVAQPDRLFERVEREVGAEMVGDLPADGHAAEPSLTNAA